MLHLAHDAVSPARLALPHAAAAPLLALVLAFTGGAAAQEPLFRDTHLALGYHPHQVVAGHVDGNATQDLIALVQVNSDLGLLPLLGDGEGDFTPGTALPLKPLGAGTAGVLAVADFDVNGTLDVAVAIGDGTGEDEVLVRLGNGDGTFGPSLVTVIASQPLGIVVADFNADELPDLAVACNASQRACVLLGDGRGGFERTDFGTGLKPRGIAAARIDGDAELDLVVCNSQAQGTVSFLRGDGAGGFFPPVASPAGNMAPAELAVGDLDGDGLQDVVVTAALGPAVDLINVLAGGGDGTFAIAGTIPGTQRPLSVALADFDENGALDVLTQSHDNDVVWLDLGNGDLTFPERRMFGTSNTPLQALPTDVNGDGDLDVVTPDHASFALTVLLGNGDGTLVPSIVPLVDGTDQIMSPFDLLLEDLDADGRTDLVMASVFGNQGNVIVHPGRIDGSFGPGAGTSSFPAGDLASGDFTGDGETDLVVINLDGPGFQFDLKFLEGHGDLTFEPAVTLPMDLRINDVEAADLDADGKLDIAYTDEHLFHVRTQLGDGAGGFGTEQIATSAGFATGDIALADFNGDARPDAIVSHAFPGPDARLFLGNGDGSFAAPLTVITGGVNKQLAIGDLNEDGVPDLVAPRHDGFDVTVVLGHGDGTFDAPVAYPAGGGFVYGVDLGDVDRDGHLDVAVTCENAGQPLAAASILLGHGDGTLGAPFTVAAGSTPRFALLRDVNGDGWLDLAMSLINSPHVTVLLNQRGPWEDLGEPLAGVAGLPRQFGEGTLLPGAPFRFTLRDSKPGGPAAHIVGLAALNAPFKGGVLVPKPTLINFPLSTNGAGELELAGPWPGAPTGLQLYLQFWLQDPAGIAGFAGSNALRVTMP